MVSVACLQKEQDPTVAERRERRDAPSKADENRVKEESGIGRSCMDLY